MNIVATMGMTPLEIASAAAPARERSTARHSAGGDQSNADQPGQPQRGEDQEHLGAPPGEQAVDEDHPQNRDRHEYWFLEAVGRQVVGRQRRRRQKDENTK